MTNQQRYAHIAYLLDATYKSDKYGAEFTSSVGKKAFVPAAEAEQFDADSIARSVELMWVMASYD